MVAIQEDNSLKKAESSTETRSVESMALVQEDHPIMNPQELLTCVLCKKQGEYAVTGRLIPYKLNMYVHTNCAQWT